jgi:hypothetical protein
MATTDFLEILRSPSLSYAEGIEFLRGKGMLNETLRRLAEDLERHGIAYAVIGAIALNQHGYRRFTEDIDVLLSPEGLQRFRDELVGRGYRPAFQGAARKFRSADHNVPVEVITAGEYPGDGKPKPIEFPRPEEAFTLLDGIRTLPLEKLIELKLASGMTAPDRLKDLADVQELIRVKGLGLDFAARLDPYVRAKFEELARGVAAGAKDPD